MIAGEGGPLGADKEAEKNILEAIENEKKEENDRMPGNANKTVYIDKNGLLRLLKNQEVVTIKAADKAFQRSLLQLTRHVVRFENANTTLLDLRCGNFPLFGLPCREDDFHPGPEFVYDILAHAKPGGPQPFRLLRTHSVVPRQFTEPPNLDELDEEGPFGLAELRRSINPNTKYAKENEFQKGKWYSGFAVPEGVLRDFLWVWQDGERKIRLRGPALDRLPPLTVPTAMSFLCEFDERGIPFVSTCVQPNAFSAVIVARDASA